MEEGETINDPEITNRIDQRIDDLAKLLHDEYIKESRDRGDTIETNPSLIKYEDLPQDLKDANKDNVRTIPEKLKRIGYDIRLQRGDKRNELSLTDEEIIILAEIEHTRWIWQKRMQGWVYNPGEKNIELKTSPTIVPWNKLVPEIQVKARDSVKFIPILLKNARCEAYKLDT